MTQDRPRIGLTVGDPAGIGPEIVVRALQAPGARDALRPVVYADRAVLERTVEMLGVGDRLHPVGDPADGIYAPGTIDYIAPEQAMGRPKFQSDVFSMGLVLYRMFSGKLPEWPFEWPLVAADRLKARVRPELIRVLQKSIQLDPKKRYRDAVQMQADFARAQSHARKQKRAKSRTGNRRGSSWRQLQWREFQRQFKRHLHTHHHCRRCEGPVAESMQACPWGGFDNPARGAESRMPSSCPRCERGVKNEWNYCAWCREPVRHRKAQ